MAIKSSELLHVGDGQVVIDRLQTGGPDSLNIPTERVYELGNYSSVGIVRDIPDLSVPMESLDVTADLERVLMGLAAIPADGTQMQISGYKPLDVAGQFKAGRRATDPTLVVGSVGMPNLYLERLEYRFGLRDFARQTATLRGSSVFYAPFESSTFVEETAGTGVAGQAIPTAHAATLFSGDLSTGPRRVLAVSVDGMPLFLGPDYTEAEGAVTNGQAIATVTLVAPVPTTSKVKVMYQSGAATNYPQTANNEGQPPPLVKPSAIRGRDIKVYINDDGSQNPANLWGSVQSASVDFRVNLDKDEEFGNYQIITQDFITPETTGSVEIKPRSYADFKSKIDQVAVVTTGETAGPYKSIPVALDIILTTPAPATRSRTSTSPTRCSCSPAPAGVSTRSCRRRCPSSPTPASCT